MESGELLIKHSQLVEKQKTERLERKQSFPPYNSINIPLTDLKIYLAIALAFLSAIVVPIRILAEGNLSYFQANPDRWSQESC